MKQAQDLHKPLLTVTCEQEAKQQASLDLDASDPEDYYIDESPSRDSFDAEAEPAKRYG